MAISDRQDSPAGDNTDDATSEYSAQSCCAPPPDRAVHGSSSSRLPSPLTDTYNTPAWDLHSNVPSHSPLPMSDSGHVYLPPLSALALRSGHHPPSIDNWDECRCGSECTCGAGPQQSEDSMALDSASPCCRGTGSPTRIERLITSLAATIPPPPENSRIGLDPSDVSVYPRGVLANPKAARIAGLVTVPRLVCCGGNCRCLSGQCGCGEECNGSCGSQS